MSEHGNAQRLIKLLLQRINSTTKSQAGKKLAPERASASLPALGLPAPSPAAVCASLLLVRGPAPQTGPLGWVGGRQGKQIHLLQKPQESSGAQFVAVAELADEDLGSRVAGEMQIRACGLLGYSSEQTGGRSLIRHGQHQVVFISLRINSSCLSARPLANLQ